MLATLSVSFTHLSNSSTVLSSSEKQQVSKTLEHSAEIMSNTALNEQLKEQPAATREEIIRINTQARHTALQIALLIPLLSALLGLLNSFWMMRLPDPTPSAAVEGAVLG